MEEIKMPHEPLSYINAKVKAEINMAIRKVTSTYPLPLFMLEGILSGILSDVRAEATSELAAETDQYEAQLREFDEAHEKMLIDSFEYPRDPAPGTPESLEGTPEPEGEDPEPEGGVADA